MKFSEMVSKSLPWIAAAASGNVPALVIMAAKAVGDAVGHPVDATPEAVESAIVNASPEHALKLREADNQLKLELRKLGVQEVTDLAKADVAMVDSVNKTMQAEAAARAAAAASGKSEGWWQTGWRPFNGYVLGAASMVTVLGVLLLAWQAISTKDFTAITALPAIVGSIAMVLAIPGAAVGITAWHRGLMKREIVEKS